MSKAAQDYHSIEYAWQLGYGSGTCSLIGGFTEAVYIDAYLKEISNMLKIICSLTLASGTWWLPPTQWH